MLRKAPGSPDDFSEAVKHPLFTYWVKLSCNSTSHGGCRCGGVLSFKLASNLPRGNIVRMALQHRVEPLPSSYPASHTALSALFPVLKPPILNYFSYTLWESSCHHLRHHDKPSLHSLLKEQFFRNRFWNPCLAPKNVYFNCFIYNPFFFIKSLVTQSLFFLAPQSLARGKECRYKTKGNVKEFLNKILRTYQAINKRRA